MYCVITFSQELPDTTQEDIREWADYVLGKRAGISSDNPLIDVELKAENIKINQ